MVRRVHRYADGGKVTKPERKAPPPPPDPSTLGTGLARKAGDALKSKRKQQMESLGLRDGGKVKRKC